MKKMKKTGNVSGIMANVSTGTVSIKQYKTPKNVLPGMYVYADGLIYPEIIEGRQIKAVVACVSNFEVLAVCLKRTKLPWSSDWLEVKTTQKMTDGQGATREILEAVREGGKSAEAVQWCYDYAEDGVKQGEAFLPSLTELEKLFANKAAINASLRALNAALLDDWYYSSNEHSYYIVWGMRMSDGRPCAYGKRSRKKYVCPVLKFKLLLSY